VAVPLSGGRYAFAWILPSPLVAFFDYQSPALLGAQEVVGKPIAFRIWAKHDPVRDGEWMVIGNVAVPEPLLVPPVFFKQDALKGTLSTTHDGSDEVPATLEQVRGLECAAVWEKKHIVDRLEDHLAGRSNRWVESMRPKALKR
jgi:hypothetical protein